MDAGTDNGFTFTSPNWPTTPQAVIFKITNSYPSHPAGSFYYPDLPTLPTIATFSFVKDKEYELSEVYHMSRDSDGDEILEIEEARKYEYKTEGVEENAEDVVTFIPKNDEKNDISNDIFDDNFNDNIDLEDAVAQMTNEIPTFKNIKNHLRGSGMKSFRRNSSGYHASTGPTDFLKKKYKSKLLKVKKNYKLRMTLI